jgi:hypothetical protein
VARQRRELRTLQRALAVKDAVIAQLRGELQAEQTARQAAEFARSVALKVAARAS